MLTFSMTFLYYFDSILVKFSPNHNKVDIFESTQKGLLKNVQDGIFKPLVS